MSIKITKIQNIRKDKGHEGHEHHEGHEGHEGQDRKGCGIPKVEWMVSMKVVGKGRGRAPSIAEATAVLLQLPK